MSERFFVESPITGSQALLVGPEAHHLLHVMRGSRGDRVTLFDGSGAEFLAEVRKTGRTEVELDVLERHAIDRELSVPLVLGVALPKGDRQKWLVEKAVELGVTQIVPLRTARGVAQPVDQALTRLGRAVIEASKQCERNRLLELSEPQTWEEFVSQPSSSAWRLVAHPAIRHTGPVAASLPATPPSRKSAVMLAIGPEGGLTPEEIDRAVATGWHLIDLGARILRTETAAMVLTAWVVQRILTAGEPQPHPGDHSAT
jgi:16S rRNA (uracil1498-N3)-methyltransferase